eukprot:Gregarina_sp_Poly_1__1213@NODE_1299_length_4435_cov_13_644231_g879_i0_p3_GENE_NODE_1299_length_4435_cov_13_644231_g879_i0NODE_1299_length_4435_cov_13_644231_g879_i0_p3_ORF_typecomplete_len276_score24_53SNF2_N/PF00176_23/1_3e38AAA_22/PF13401_6/26AAA_22/PF13401_6/0_78ResIII/PF04851_15/0_074ResIII/PF04851_15/3_1e02DEAD_2/PF06733_15/1_5DEAD_2/PF06733_15/1_4e02Ku_PK_bind/PF08785_11/0_28BLOC1S3/PF15753_5/1_5e03BLOC1S3/PF15753_5/0_45BLOC1S3/PF15753_5/2_4e03_NODE_1299_length_4435_cov_13_644231_g879_i015
MDIVLTTYGTVLSEFNKSSVLFRMHFHRIVIDESHSIRNRLSQTTLAVLSLSSDIKWCLSGTPIQNSLHDIYTSFKFIRIEPWCHWTWWTKLVDPGLDESIQIKRLKILTSPILLRRTMHTMDPDTQKPIISLPQRHTIDVWLRFDSNEENFYRQIFRQAKQEFTSLMEQNAVSRNYVSVLQLLLRLRQSCCHPLLMYSGVSGGNTIIQLNPDSDVSQMSKTLQRSMAELAKNNKPELQNTFIRNQIKKLIPNSFTDPQELSTKLQACPICLESP